MDGSRFDSLAKAMHASPSRRRFLGSLAGITGAAIVGRASIDEVLAQDVGANAYDLTCRNRANAFCYDRNAEAKSCGPNSLNCKCARTRRGKEAVCVVEPRNNKCPTRRSGCRNDSDCARNEACISIRACCPRRKEIGICAQRCDEGAGGR